MIRGRLAIAIAVAVALLPASTVNAAPEGAAYEEAFIDVSDGTTLHADILKPAGLRPGQRTPVLMTVTPYAAHGGAGSNPTERGSYGFVTHFARRLHAWENGWTVVVVDLPGFGGSSGCWDLGGPKEVTAVKAAVEWAADQPWSTGKVALAGGSYDGGTALMGLAAGARGLAAAVAMMPQSSPYGIFYSGGVPRPSRTVYPAAFALWDQRAPGTYDDTAQYHGNWLDHQRPECASRLPDTFESDAMAAYWVERDLRDRVARSEVPVFGTQGLLDLRVPSHQLLSLWPRLRRPEGLWLGQATHWQPVDFPTQFGRAGADAQVERFLLRHLSGVGSRVSDPQVVVQEAPSLRWRTEARWPPADARPVTLTVSPGRYEDRSGNTSGDAVDADFPAPIPMNALPMTGLGTWTFSQPVVGEAHLAGMPTLRVRATGPPAARLVALLYDVAPDGRAYLITRGATLLRGGEVELFLEPQDWRVAEGHRLGLLLSGADESWWPGSTGTGAEVRVLSGELSLPLLSRVRDRFVDGERGVAWDRIKHPIRITAETIEQGTTGTIARRSSR